MPAVEKAASVCGGRRGGGRGGSTKGITRKGKGGKVKNGEPLGSDPKTLPDDEIEEEPKITEEEDDFNKKDNVKQQGLRKQTARRGKPFSTSSGTRKIETRPCSVDMRREDVNKSDEIKTNKKSKVGNGKKKKPRLILKTKQTQS